MKKQILRIQTENTPGVLNKIASTIRKKKYNIESLTVDHTFVEGISQFVITFNENDDKAIQLIAHQINKIVEVLNIEIVTEKDTIERGIMLIKINYEPKEINKLHKINKKYSSTIIDMDDKQIIIQIIGKTVTLEAALDEYKTYNIENVVRTGITVINRLNK